MDTLPDGLPTIQEHAFLQLVDGAGKVQIGIRRFDRYFVPFVYHTPPSGGHQVPCGVILRRRDMFAAATRDELLGVLSEIAGPDVDLDITPDSALH